jgi:hypothetical protein
MFHMRGAETNLERTDHTMHPLEICQVSTSPGSELSWPPIHCDDWASRFPCELVCIKSKPGNSFCAPMIPPRLNLNWRSRRKTQTEGAIETELLQNSIRQNMWTWLLAVLTGIWLVGANIFAWAVSSNGSLAALLISSNNARTLLILRVLAEGVSISLTTLIASTLSILFWSDASGSRGVEVPRLLAMSPTTGIGGLLELLMWRTGLTKSYLGWHHFWVMSRFHMSQ